jgi:hypothetical protein
MSLHIPDKFLDVASSVTATIDLTMLGPLQQSALKRYCQTGVIRKRGLVANLAIRLLGDRPYIMSTGHDMRWQGIPTDENDHARKALIACLVLDELQQEEQKIPMLYANDQIKLEQHLKYQCKIKQDIHDVVYKSEDNKKCSIVRFRNSKPLSSVNFKHDFNDAFFEQKITYDLLNDMLP